MKKSLELTGTGTRRSFVTQNCCGAENAKQLRIADYSDRYTLFERLERNERIGAETILRRLRKTRAELERDVDRRSS